MYVPRLLYAVEGMFLNNFDFNPVEKKFPIQDPRREFTVNCLN